MKVKIKKLSDKAVIPFYSKVGDAGLDLVATSIEDFSLFVEYGTSLAIEIHSGHIGLIFPRSSISNYHLSLCNSVGVIDSNYRGELKVRFRRLGEYFDISTYNIGDRIAQLIIIPYPSIKLEEVEELVESERNEQGFGSSGK